MKKSHGLEWKDPNPLELPLIQSMKIGGSPYDLFEFLLFFKSGLNIYLILGNMSGKHHLVLGLDDFWVVF